MSFNLRLCHLRILILIVSAWPSLISGQDSPRFWNPVSRQVVMALPRYNWPASFQAIEIDETDIRSRLQHCPKEKWPFQAGYGQLLEIPLPDGNSARFRIYEVSIMEPGLSHQFPSFRTYAGYGEDDPLSMIRISLTDLGFQAMIRTTAATIFIDPVTTFPNSGYYLVYNRSDLSSSMSFLCETEDKILNGKQRLGLSENVAMRSTGTQLRSYRLAVAATGEYTTFYGGTVSGAMSGIVASMNRVNFVYETEVSIRLNLIATNNQIVYTNASTDPYTNGNGSTMLGQNQTNLDAVIGLANYDVGHVFSTGGGGVAVLNSPCSSTNKARGVTGSGSPVGDPFDIDYVAHEIGHQFGGLHTFNGTTGNCSGGNRSGTAAYEPGSGVTIMAYAGICGAENLASNSIPYFHTYSYDQISNFITTGGGNACAAITNTGNNPPVISLGSTLTFTIPYLTPFQLTGSATDPDGDPLTYSWEQFDLGASTTSTSLISSDGPIFRSFNPQSTSTRVFPKISDILNNTTTYGESLPAAARNLKFRLTVRDNRTGGGGVSNGTDTVKISVVNTGAAFAVTSPNTAISWVSGGTATVSWNVSQTNIVPVSCANVRILLSTDSGFTFPIVLAATTTNDGSEVITVPAIASTTARVKVEAVGNIFFDISNTNFNITSGNLSTLTTAVSFSSACAGQSVNVSFAGNAPALSGNVYYALLSGATGSFVTADTIGTLNSVSSADIIACVIPANVSSGSGYRIRVVASSPAVIASNNGSNITIGGTLTATGSITGNATVSSGQAGVVYSVPAVANATSYMWTSPFGASITAGNNTRTITVSFGAGSSSGLVTVTPSNICFTGTLSSRTIVVDNLPFPAGSITGNATVCEVSTGISYTISPVSGATGYNWSLPTGAVIVSGNGTNSILVNYNYGAIPGNVTVTPFNSFGNGLASSLAIEVTPAGSPAIINPSGPLTTCSPVTLSFTPEPGNSYEWRRDGIALGLNASVYSASQSGNYNVSSSRVLAKTFTAPTDVNINDNICTAAVSNIDVSGYNGNISTGSMYVTLDLTHTYVSDLVIFLEAPNGQILGLFNRSGGGGDNFVNTVFADSGLITTATGSAPYTGLYKPLASTFANCIASTVTTFAGIGGGSISPNGTWRLLVYDRASQDIGAITNWSISFPGGRYGCVTIGNSVALNYQSPPAVSSFSPTSGISGTVVQISGHNLNGTTNVLFNGISAATFTINSNSLITATAPASVTSGNLELVHPCGNLSAGNFSSNTFSVLNLRVFLQGFYTGSSVMTSVVGGGVTDTIRVELHNSTNPFATVHTATGVINSSGYGNFSFPGAVIGNSYFIVVRHRNSLETWSKLPVLFTAVTSYDFTF
jgi:subtilisin-like proprotein convertase family protein